MTSDCLFDRRSRKESDRPRYQEPTFVMLNRRQGKAWDEVRDLIETWFAAVPPGDRADLRGRLQSAADRDFRSAFHELYWHEVLRRSGYLIDFHPALGHTRHRPDFGAWRGGTALYLEATVTAPTARGRAAQARRDQLIDEINAKLPIENFMLSVDVVDVGAATPSATGLVTKLRTWLSGLDVEQLSAAGTDELASLEWRVDGWHLNFEAFPLAEGARGPGGRIMGAMSAGGAEIIDDASPIRRRIDEKAKRYGTTLDAGFVIAVDTDEPFVDDDDVSAALYGTQAIRYWQNPRPDSPPPRFIRLADGMLWGPRGPRRTHTSAVITTTALLPWLVASQPPTWWPHPAADKPLEPVAPIFRTVALDPMTKRLRTEPAATDPATFFGLADDWPHFDVSPKHGDNR